MLVFFISSQNTFFFITVFFISVQNNIFVIARFLCFWSNTFFFIFFFFTGFLHIWSNNIFFITVFFFHFWPKQYIFFITGFFNSGLTIFSLFLVFFISDQNTIFIIIGFLHFWSFQVKPIFSLLRHELELVWIKLLQTPHPLGFNDNIYHEGNISRLPDFGVFSILDIHKRNNRSHGKCKNGIFKRKNKHVLTLSELSIILKHSGRHMALSHLVTLSISSVRNLDIEANEFYEKAHRLYDAAILTRCYNQHALWPDIDSEINHIRHFIKIQFVNKGIEFIDLPSIFKDKSVISSIPTYFVN